MQATQWDPSRLFQNTPHVEATIVPMDHPFLLSYGFDSPKNSFKPDVMSALLYHYCKRVVECGKGKEVAFRERLERRIKDTGKPEWPNGFFGTDNLPEMELCS